MQKVNVIEKASKDYKWTTTVILYVEAGYGKIRTLLILF